MDLKLPQIPDRKSLQSARARSNLVSFDNMEAETACSTTRSSSPLELNADQKAKLEFFMNYKPAYTAAEFEEKVCGSLNRIYNSYEESAQRYEKAIKTTEQTIRTAQHGINKSNREMRIHARNLNDGLRKIGAAIVFGQTTEPAQ